MKKYIFLLALIIMVAGLFTGIAFAQGSEPTDDEVNAIAKQLYCPVCQNTPLDVCPTEACRQWRELIRSMLAEGKSEEEILQYFEQQYGPRVRQEPPRSGFSWLAYIIPALIIVAGVVFLARALKAWTKAPLADLPEDEAGDDESDAGSADEYVSRFEEELKKRK
jgi:cytochrome c-type biogenesis protein CcmH